MCDVAGSKRWLVGLCRRNAESWLTDPQLMFYMNHSAGIFVSTDCVFDIFIFMIQHRAGEKNHLTKQSSGTGGFYQTGHFSCVQQFPCAYRDEYPGGGEEDEMLVLALALGDESQAWHEGHLKPEEGAGPDIWGDTYMFIS